MGTWRLGFRVSKLMWCYTLKQNQHRSVIPGNFKLSLRKQLWMKLSILMKQSQLVRTPLHGDKATCCGLSYTCCTTTALLHCLNPGKACPDSDLNPGLPTCAVSGLHMLCTPHHAFSCVAHTLPVPKLHDLNNSRMLLQVYIHS